MRLSLADAADRTGFEQTALQSWEVGQSQPTIRQARHVAKIYQVPFAALYLAAPPDAQISLPHDYRRIAGTALGSPTYEIVSAVQEAWHRREFTLELYGLSKTTPRTLKRTLDLEQQPEQSGARLRQALGISIGTQCDWHDPRIAFNAWRASVEELGVLVFQQSGLDLEQMRGFSLDVRPLPVIVINRTDGYASRTFTLLHELVHIFLRNAGLCDLVPSPDRPPEEQRIEVYCNATVAACLIPTQELLRHPLLNVTRMLDQWTDEDIHTLAVHFSVSREALLRRLLTLRRTNQRFYEQKRNQYIQEARSRVKRPGFAPPAIDALSRLGKPFVKLVLSAYNSRSVTASDASEFLGLRAKHFQTLSESIGAW